MPAEEPYASLSLIASAYWFGYFLVILPLLGVLEKPLPQPDTIEEDFNKKYPPKEANLRPSQPKYLLSEPRIINIMFLVNSIRNFFAVIFFTATSTFAAGGGDNYVKDYKFSFEGPLGSLIKTSFRGVKGLRKYAQRVTV